MGDLTLLDDRTVRHDPSGATISSALLAALDRSYPLPCRSHYYPPYEGKGEPAVTRDWLLLNDSHFRIQPRDDGWHLVTIPEMTSDPV